MREIKFRAWLPQYETMVDEKFVSNDVLSVDDISFELSSSGVQVYVLELYDREVGGEHDQGYEFTLQKDASIMQYTGLKDKNGVEIYECDILNVKIQEVTKENIFNDPHFIAGKSKYHTGKKVGAIWTVEHVDHITYTGFSVYGLNRRFNRAMTKSLLLNTCAEVIGNIYENPELLGDNND